MLNPLFNDDNLSIKIKNMTISYDVNKTIIHNCIFHNIFKIMEYNIENRIIPCIDINFIKKISNKDDMNKVINYIKYIYNVYNNYLYAILFNYYDMEGPDSGEDRTLKDFKNNYDIIKIYYCTSTSSDLYKILYKYVDVFNNIQNIDQNNLLSNS